MYTLFPLFFSSNLDCHNFFSVRVIVTPECGENKVIFSRHLIQMIWRYFSGNSWKKFFSSLRWKKNNNTETFRNEMNKFKIILKAKFIYLLQKFINIEFCIHFSCYFVHKPKSGDNDSTYSAHVYIRQGHVFLFKYCIVYHTCTM